MTNNIIYIVLDVDDASFHGCALGPSTGETLTFKCRLTVKDLIRQDNKPKVQILMNDNIISSAGWIGSFSDGT